MIPKISASEIYSVLGNNNSIIPLGIKDVANSCGLTTASYLAGDKLEGKDRFIDEFGTQAIWLWGIPAYKYLIDKTLFKAIKIDPEVDVRIFKNKDILELAKKYAPTKSIQESIINASKNQKLSKGLTLAKFIISTTLTALSYLGLTKYRHQYTENKVKKDYFAKRQQNYAGENIPFSSSFSHIHKQADKKISFTGGLHDFIFNPVKNLMLVDATITGERLTCAKNPQDFLGYVIKEGSFWAFMYGAGGVIAKALEKHSETKYNKSIDLDARVIENPKFKEAFANGKIKTYLNDFKKIGKSEADIYRFAVNPETDNLIVEMAKLSDIISVDKHSGRVDTRKYIDIKDLKEFYNKVEKLLTQYETSGENVDVFFKSLRKLKRASVLKNIGACIMALGVIAPAIMLATRKLGDNKEYQVKKDIEAKLSQQI